MNWLWSRWRALVRWYYTRRVRRTCASCRGLVRANYRTVLTPQTHLGHNVHFNGLYIQGRGKVVIGDNFHSGEECRIITDIHNYQGESLPYDNTYVVKDVTIADNVWIGTRVMILGGVEIGEGAIIQAGSVVVSDIPPLAIAGGHPARVFAHRDHEHYERLKQASRFH